MMNLMNYVGSLTFRNFDFLRDKAMEEMERNRLKSLDRHELEKALDQINVPYFDHEETEHLREKLQTYMETTGLSYDFIFRPL